MHRTTVRLSALVLLASLTGCRSGGSAPAETTTSESEAPALIGRVADADGVPVPDVRIRIYGGLATRWRIGETTTDGDGRYAFDPMPAGSMVKDEEHDRWDYYVGMSLEHETLVSSDGRSWWDVRVPHVPGAVKARDFTLIAGGEFHGRLTDADTGEPMPDVDLRVQSPNREWVLYSRYAKSGEDGWVHLTGLAPGGYIVDINDSGRDYPIVGEFSVSSGGYTQSHMRYRRCDP